jgi:branched-chain amino acid transport system permease protein
MDKKMLKNYIINLIVVALIYVGIKVLISAGVINRYYEGIIIFIMINIILATSLNLATGFLGQLTLGHAGFMAAGAYVSAITAIALKNSGMPNLLILIISLIAAAIVSALVGIAIGIPALRLRGDYLAIITLGFGEMIRVIINNLRGLTGGAQGLTGIPRIATFDNVFWVTALVILVLYRLTHSRQGRAIVSIREDEIAAEAVGVKTTYFKVLGFAIAAGFAGVGGGLYAHYLAFLDPKIFGFMRSVEILVIVVLGGMGSLTGSIFAAIILTILPEALRSFSDYRMILYSFALVLMMIFRPIGMFGTKEFSWQGIYDRYKMLRDEVKRREKA